MINRFFCDLKKYYKYSITAAKVALKTEVSGSYLNWLWWVLEPVCYTLIYAFVFGFVFSAKEPYFIAFISIGLAFWQFFSQTVTKSVKLIKANRSILQKVYLPKFVLVITLIMVNGFKMTISFVITAVIMAIYKVKLDVSMLYIIPIIIILLIFTFAVATILMHWGVYVQDLTNVIAIVLKFLFYFTGIMYDIRKRIPTPYGNLILKLNPVACMITQARDCLLYGKIEYVKLLAVYLIVSLLLAVLAVKIVYKNENTYVKVS